MSLPGGGASRPPSAMCGMPRRGRRATMYQREHMDGLNVAARGDSMRQKIA